MYRARERARAMYSRPGLRGHPCRFMPRAFVCTRDGIGGIWFDERFWFGPLCEVFQRENKKNQNKNNNKNKNNNNKMWCMLLYHSSLATGRVRCVEASCLW